jgi:hypothetical protein
VYVEIVVGGQLGDLARWALSDLTVERRQTIVVSTDELARVVETLDEFDADIVAIREVQIARCQSFVGTSLMNAAVLPPEGEATDCLRDKTPERRYEHRKG